MRWVRWFIAGAVAVPLFHQAALYALNMWGYVDRAPFSMAATQPFGVPQVISLSFWGGLWGVILGIFISERVPRVHYWLIALIFGAILPTLVAAFVVPPLKGAGVPADLPKFFLTGAIVNGAWGAGTALLYLLMTPRRRI
jgi:hypothetical protein